MCSILWKELSSVYMRVMHSVLHCVTLCYNMGCYTVLQCYMDVTVLHIVLLVLHNSVTGVTQCYLLDGGRAVHGEVKGRAEKLLRLTTELLTILKRGRERHLIHDDPAVLSLRTGVL